MKATQALPVFTDYFDKYCNYYEASLTTHYGKPCIKINYRDGSGGYTLDAEYLTETNIYIELYDIVSNFNKHKV